MSEGLQQHFYTVRPGDTVYNIAKRWELPIESLIAANNLVSPYIIFIGQQLSMPIGVTHYRVQQGDSLYRISEKYGIPLSLLIEANNLLPPYVIYPDQLVVVPPGAAYYVVQQGDSLYQIARRYNVITAGIYNFELIRQVNDLPSTIIVPGMRLIIPYAPTGEIGLIAYTSDHGGDYDIWLYNLRNGVHAQLTYGQADYFTIPFWSRDSRYIAFVGKDFIVYVVEVSSGAVAQIDQLVEGEVHTLDWSFDSQRLAYTKQNQIILYNISSHQSQMINEPSPTDVQWFPDGTTLLFQTADFTGISQLFRISIDQTSIQQLTMNQQGPLNHVRLASNGRFVLYTTPGASISLIYTVDIFTGQVFEVRGGPLAKNYFPEWSLDSKNIAYSATAFLEQGYYSLIRTVGNRGENDRTWAISDCFATPVTWSPDSPKIVYLSGCQSAAVASEMWYVDLNHPVPIQLISGRSIQSMRWSPTQMTLPSRVYSNEEFNIRLQYPMNWFRVNPERYEGTDGFFQIAAINAGPEIDVVCQDEAFHQLLPYGTQPRIVHTMLQNQDACFIFPSADQPEGMKGQAALIVRYPSLIKIGGSTYNYFILWASKEHINQLASTLAFLSS
ncbi:LysM peptidoglycan-binding domain-containing protein [Anaerobacillus sp. CMMVII]|uniref:LysM peptidoglycan-binding domain-containing protein n=1 Tax=Anaerobacillus sp. CMMVII TaxID=2755588 RepID=UPI0021B83315|nr:LysM peptidoglycan-binding domain-containing protein [Anaerobacillus sp. CMMVII]MCT8139922.1 LysM peptidoglycan-binding domain-containing protein [Anaerobacillus sp. CMMVII]